MAFVVFEGIDGSGKTSLIRRLAAQLKAEGQSFVVTREPGGTALGDAIRELLIAPHGEPPTARAELLLYEAGRAQHVAQVIEPALAKGEWVLCDRFTASSVAFQGDARGIDAAAVASLNEFATEGLEADLTVLIDLEPSVGEARRQKRVEKTGVALDRFELEKSDFHNRVRESYLQQANRSRFTARPWLVLDGHQTEDELFSALLVQLRAQQWLES